MQRYVYLDRLKGFAMIAVIVHHLYLWPIGGIKELNSFFTVFMLSLFFFVSGFLTKPTTTEKLLIKIVSLLSPAIFLGLLYNYLSYGYFSFDFILRQNKVGYWFLWVLAELNILFFFYFKIEKYLNRLLFKLSCAFFFFLLIAITDKLLPKSVNDMLSLYSVTVYWPIFILGYFTAKSNTIRSFIENEICYSISFLISFVLFVYLIIQESFGVRLILSYLSVIPLFYLFKKHEESNSRINRLIEYIGRNTLNIYILHYFILKTISIRFVGDWFVETNNILFNLVVWISVAIIVCFLSILFGNLLRESKFLRGILWGDFFITLIKSINDKYFCTR